MVGSAGGPAWWACCAPSLLGAGRAARWACSPDPAQPSSVRGPEALACVANGCVLHLAEAVRDGLPVGPDAAAGSRQRAAPQSQRPSPRPRSRRRKRSGTAPWRAEIIAPAPPHGDPVRDRSGESRAGASLPPRTNRAGLPARSRAVARALGSLPIGVGPYGEELGRVARGLAHRPRGIRDPAAEFCSPPQSLPGPAARNAPSPAAGLLTVEHVRLGARAQNRMEIAFVVLKGLPPQSVGSSR